MKTAYRAAWPFRRLHTGWPGRVGDCIQGGLAVYETAYRRPGHVGDCIQSGLAV